MSARPWWLIASLLLLAAVYAGWLGNGRHAVASLLVFALPPLLLAGLLLAHWQQARYWCSVVALGWFSHGVMRAWTDRPDSLPGVATLTLALLVIALASGPAARARLASKRKPPAH